MITIRRYTNRKYYISKKGYISFKYILDLIKQNKEFRVFDESSKSDITGKVLSQIILDFNIKVDETLLLELIRSGVEDGSGS